MMLGGHKRPKTTRVGSEPRSKKARTLEHEQSIADRLGGKRQPASGAMLGHKGDVKLTDFLLDSKETVHASIIISGKDLTKITREADGEGKIPGLVITIERVPRTVATEWVMIPLDSFGDLLRLGGE